MVEEVAVDKSRGDGPPCIVETQLPDVQRYKKDCKRLEEDNKGALVSRAKVRSYRSRLREIKVIWNSYFEFQQLVLPL